MIALTWLAFCSDWTCNWVSRKVMFNLIHLCLDSIIFIYWLDLIRSSLMTQSNFFLIELTSLGSVLRIDPIIFHLDNSTNWFTLSIPYPFNYLDSDVIPFTLNMEDGERRSQWCSDEHDWFSPDLVQNNWGQWYPNIYGGFNYPYP